MSKKKTILPPDRYRTDFSKEYLDSFWRQEVEKIIPLYINDIRQVDTTEELTNILLNFAVHSFNKGFRSR